jgi:hypothetical protein
MMQVADIKSVVSCSKLEDKAMAAVTATIEKLKKWKV